MTLWRPLPPPPAKTTNFGAIFVQSNLVITIFLKEKQSPHLISPYFYLHVLFFVVAGFQQDCYVRQRTPRPEWESTPSSSRGFQGTNLSNVLVVKSIAFCLLKLGTLKRRLLKRIRIFFCRKDGKPPNFFVKAAIGMSAGGVGAFVGTPAEVALIRMTADGR